MKWAIQELFSGAQDVRRRRLHLSNDMADLTPASAGSEPTGDVANVEANVKSGSPNDFLKSM